MSEALIVAIVLVVLAAITAGVAVIHRGRNRSFGSTPGDVVQHQVGETPPPGTLGQDDLVLISLPNRRGQALALGSDDALAVLDAGGVLDSDADQSPGQLGQLVRSVLTTGGVEATRRAQIGINSGRIVALTEESVRRLDHGKPVYDKARNMLGVVKGDKGRFSHVVRLDAKGAQAVVASNAATLAMTVAVGQQLAAIEAKLAEISETLDRMVRQKETERLAEVVASNAVLRSIADDVRRRGMTDREAARLSDLDLPVMAKQIEAEFKFDELLGGDGEKLTRHDRVQRLARLADKERLDYWLALRVQADLAQTRLDILNLQWEITRHPDTAGEITERVRANIELRQRRLHAIGRALEDLADPEARTKLDPLRQVSRWKLQSASRTIGKLLERHDDVFISPEQDDYAISGRTRKEAARTPLPREAGAA